MKIDAGRRAFVTGGASGFGLAVARSLVASEARVAIADVDSSALARAAVDLGELATTLEVDVSDSRQVREAVDTAAKEFGGLDTLVLCAGVIHVKPLDQVSEEDFDRTIRVNLKGAFLTAQAAAPLLSASGRGRIVAISSDAGKKGFPWITAYCASKFGLIGLCESLGAELAGSGVTVNCVCPSSCPATGMGQMLTTWKAKHSGSDEASTLRSIAASFPLGRYIEIDDVVSTVMFLLSGEAAALTGLAIDVDAGMHLGGTIPGAERS